MEQLVAQVLAVVKGMWRFRWPSLAVAWLVAIIGVLIVFRVPDKYEATARIYVDTQSILKPLMAGLAVQPNVQQQVVMLSRTLISRPNMEKLVRMADLDLKAESKADQDAVITSLINSVSVSSVGRDNLYALSYRDSDPGKAQRVVQSLVSIFVESSLGASRKDANEAKSFLEEQIKTYEAKLQEAEARVKAFQIRNIELSTGQGIDSTSRLSELGDQLKKAKLELREAEQSRDAAKKQIESLKAQPMPTSALSDSAAAGIFPTPEIDSRISVQQRNLDSLLQRFTELHPDVLSARRLIKDLEEQKRKQVKELRQAALAASGASTGNSGSQAYQAMDQMLASSELQVAALRARVAEYSNRYNQTLELLKTKPQIDAEATQLNRDYAIHKKNYDNLVARRESAAMTGELDTAAGVVDFRLIDPPRVAPNPVAPNRLLLVGLAFVAAVGAGLFTAFAGSQLRPVFHSAFELRSRVAIPLLGVVSQVTNAVERRRERMNLIRFVFGTGGLLGMFAVAFVAISIMTARRMG
jgi:polysaccharide chain length determinant protein (PEP-CTERM system associated)